MGTGQGLGRGPGLFLGTEVCATLLLLCWLCCWPDDSNSDSSCSPEHCPGRYPSKPMLIEPESRRRGGALCGRRAASSAASLHLPSTSGYAKQSLAAHRSHEEIRSRRKSHHETTDNVETRYHSAPSVIDEVLHRRDWERSSKDLYIPLRPPEPRAGSTPSLAPRAVPDPDSSSECLADPRPLCKKHYTNIKSSKGRKCKESNRDDIKDTDATEVEATDSNNFDNFGNFGSFYIGDNHEESTMMRTSNDEHLNVPSVNYEDYADHEKSDERSRLATRASNEDFTRASASKREDLVEYESSLLSYEEEFGRPSASDYEVLADDRWSEERGRAVYRAKEAKQSLNESIRLKELPRALAPLAEGEVRCFALESWGEAPDAGDRSGAVHHTIESRISLRQYPPPSVETVGYEGGACYLAEAGPVSQLRAPHALGARGLRARHASDGDILAPPHRPESGAFSESDLDLDLESEERPPDYAEAQLYASPERKETAI